MPVFNAEVSHELSREDALDRLTRFVARVAEKYRDQVSRMEGNWQDNVLNFSLTTYGFTITGVLTVEDRRALLDGQLPFAAIAFRGKIEKAISHELERVLGAGSVAGA